MQVEAVETETVVVASDKPKGNYRGAIRDGVIKSWLDESTAVKRVTRHNVQVNGVWYRSVREAFKELGLPDKHHQEFRLKLKTSDSGHAIYTDGDGLEFEFSLGNAKVGQLRRSLQADQPLFDEQKSAEQVATVADIRPRVVRRRKKAGSKSEEE